MTSDALLERSERVFAALADSTRIRLLSELARHGGATATVLSRELPVSRQAVVKHLSVLKSAGLVVRQRSGREARYIVQPEPLDATAQWMAQLAAEWDRRLARIKLAAEEDEGGCKG